MMNPNKQVVSFRSGYSRLTRFLKLFVLVSSLSYVLAGCSSSSYTKVSLPTAATLPSSCTAATVGTNYSCSITATNGKAPFKWTVMGLPTGLTDTVSTDTKTLTISGTPQAQNGVASAHVVEKRVPAITPIGITVTVTDANGQSANIAFNIAISPPPGIAITTATLPGGTAGVAYSASVTASGGTTPYTWTITGLPSGITFTSGTPSASISGTTTNAGSFTVSAQVTDAASNSVTAMFTLTIAQAAALTITTATLPNGTINVAYSQTLAAMGGVTPYTWTTTSGMLPAGLTLSSGGVISGTPTTAVSSTFTIQAADSESPAQTTSATLTITITATAAFGITTTSPLAGATVGSSYSAMVTASGGMTPYTFALATGSSLPAGLTLTSGTPSATISGTPTATGTFKFTLMVTDSSTPTPATVSATFLLTVTGSSTLNCPATVNLTLCGTYAMGFRGFNGGGPIAGGIVFVANNSGQIISGMKEVNQSTGAAVVTITGGSFAMDSSGDGRGVLTLIDSTAATATYRFVLESLANAGFNPIEEFDNSGTLASGVMLGPETSPLPQIPGNTVISLELEGVNGSGQRSAMIGVFQFGPNGCDGSAGSLNSVSGEPIVTNTAGTVNAALTATGSCMPVDPNTGIGTAQITLAGGTPFSNSALHFTYVIVGSGTSIQGGFFLETDTIGTNQPILSGLAESAQPPTGGYNAASLGCPCLLGRSGSTDGTTTTGHSIASIVRLVTTPGAGASGTLTGVEDLNAGGTVTLAAALGPYNYTVDANGVGTISAPSVIHFVDVGGTIYTVDESVSVLTGSFRPQNATTIQSPGAPYITGLGNGDLLGVNASVDNVVGVLIPSGATSGTLTGTVDNASSTGNTAGITVSGTYAGIDANGRGTGTLNLTGGTSGLSIVIYASRGRQFVILDAQSTDPYLLGTRLQ